MTQRRYLARTCAAGCRHPRGRTRRLKPRIERLSHDDLDHPAAGERLVIPVLVGQFIALFKDTSLVATIGLLDLLGISDPFWPNRPISASSTGFGVHHVIAGPSAT